MHPYLRVVSGSRFLLLVLATSASSAQETLLSWVGGANSCYGTDGEQLGKSVADAGDLTGDGVPDVLLGAPGADGWGLCSGWARVYSGAGRALVLDLDGGPNSGGYGIAVDGLGDLDGDGAGDFAVGGSSFVVPGFGQPGRVYVYSAAGTGWRSNLPVAGSLSSLVAAVPRVERSVADPVGSTPDSEVICKTTGRETLRNARELTAGVGHDSMAVCLITGRETLRRMRASSEELAVLPPVDPSECRATVYGSGSGISDLGILTALITGRETTRPALGLYRT